MLVVEDGDEYMDNLSRFVTGPDYVQVHDGRAALDALGAGPVDLVYLDMRFDRIPREDLLGDHVVAMQQHNGDPIRAWRYLQNHQGLFILDAMRRAGHADVPVVLAYDFSRETARLEHLQGSHPLLRWVPDAVTPDEIRRTMRAAIDAGRAR